MAFERGRGLRRDVAGALAAARAAVSWRVALAGVAAAASGLLATLVLVLVETTETIPGDVTTTFGWVFYDAHGVPVAGPGGRFSLLSSLPADPAVPAAAYYLVPPAALAAAGAVVASRGRTAAAPGASLGVGASLAAGYLAVLAVGTQVFTVYRFGATAGPVLVLAAAAGVAYPLAFGSVGAYLGERVASPQV